MATAVEARSTTENEGEFRRMNEYHDDAPDTAKLNDATTR
jgi:hypothetical protein